MTEGIREEFEKTNWFKRCDAVWCDTVNQYRHVGGDYVNYAAMSAFDLFSETYQSRQPEIDQLRAEVERMTDQLDAFGIPKPLQEPKE